MKLKKITILLKNQIFKTLSLTGILLCLLISDQANAQINCSTPQEPSKRNGRYRSNISFDRVMQTSYYVKIYPHVIRNEDGSGGYTDAEVEEILGYLDASFNQHQIFFVWDNEIDYIEDDIRAYYGPGAYYDDEDIYSVNNHTDGIDIYIFPETAISDGGRANGVGESSEFWVSGTLEGFPVAKSYVTAHEMGHVLNLWHTHHGCETGDWELVDGSNCTTAGDFVCDTPADPLLSFYDVYPETCEWSYFNYCGAPEDINSYMPDTKNIMSYTAISCLDYFSNGQGERMREALATLPYLQATITNVNTSACNIDDWEALKQLYSLTNGDDWKINTNWDILKQDTIPEDCSLRGLHGITFDITGRITAVNLYDNNLVGTLPDEIGNLTSLKYLDLGFNLLSDTLNENIGNLSALEILFLDNNQFSGSIPFSLLELNNLGQFNIQNNNLSGCFDVKFGKWCGRFLSSNFSVEGGSNNFDADFETFCNNGDGICPIERCNIKEWRTLKQFYKTTNGNSWTDNLNWDMVTGNLPVVDCDLRNLRGVSLNTEGRVIALDLYDNNLTGYLPYEIGDLEELTYLDLGYNLINDTIPSSFSKLTKLMSLYLDNNKFRGDIPSSFGDIAKLSLLYLNNNNLTGCPDSNLLKLCTKLNENYNKNQYLSEGNLLNIEWEKFCEFGVDSCEVSPCEADWIALKQLYLDTDGGNWFSNNGWDIVLEERPPLENCNFNDLYGVESDENGNVISIDLTRNNLNGTLPAQIGDMRHLEILDLCVNDLSGPIPDLGNLENLFLLDLHDNQFSGEIPISLGKLTSLTDMLLYENQLTGAVPLELGNLENLQILYFDFNQLSGTLPPELGNLTNVVELSFSNNSLTGNIPRTFGDLENLIYLYLYNNDLDGCHDVNLLKLCPQTFMDIDFGNNFDAPWFDFCDNGAGTCLEAAFSCNLPVLNLDEGQHSEGDIVHSAQNIYSKAVIKVQTTYKASKGVELKEGFEADGLYDFSIDIEKCE